MEASVECPDIITDLNVKMTTNQKNSDMDYGRSSQVPLTDEQKS